MKIVGTVENKEWARYVSIHPYGNIFQSPEINVVYSDTDYYEPVFIAAKERGDIQGLIQGVIIQESGFIKGKMSSRCVVRGGPLVSDPSVVGPLLEKFSDRVEKKAIFTQLRNLFDTSHYKKKIIDEDFDFDSHLNYLVDLDCSEDEVWNGFSKSRRKGIRQAQRAGIKVKKVSTAEEMEILYDLIQKTYSRVQIPVASKSLFTSAFKNLSDKKMILPLLAYKKGIPIAGRIALCYMHTIYDWYAGDEEGYRDEHANELLVWEFLKHGVEGSYKIFDFGGAGHPDEKYGPREFKRRFGGKKVNFGRYEKVHKPIMLSMSEKAYKLYRRLL